MTRVRVRYLDGIFVTVAEDDRYRAVYVWDSFIHSNTLVSLETLEGFAPTKEAPPKEKETPEEIKKRARKPPAGGKCIRCGEYKPINRLKMCYPCWTKFMLEKDGWKEGQPHPPTCGCDLDCRFDKKGADN